MSIFKEVGPQLESLSHLARIGRVMILVPMRVKFHPT